MALALLVSTGPGLGQAPAPRPGSAATPAAPAPQPIPSEPSVTTASFGDWTLRCQRVDDNGKTSRICEVAQMMQAQGQQTPIAQVALGRMAAGEPLRITAVMPVSVSFPSSVQITLGDKDAKPLDLAWKRCIPAGCFAEAVPGDDVLRQWRKASEAGRIVFKDAAGRDLALPLSARGLEPALEALAKERL
jgi:invasion protein IalB